MAGHAATPCPHPAIRFEKRQCFNCKEVGHAAKEYLKARAVGSVKVVESNEPAMCMRVDADGFPAVKRNGVRPMPKPAVGDYVLRNVYAPLHGSGGTRGAAVARTPTALAAGAKPPMAVAGPAGRANSRSHPHGSAANDSRRLSRPTTANHDTVKHKSCN